MSAPRDSYHGQWQCKTGEIKIQILEDWLHNVLRMAIKPKSAHVLSLLKTKYEDRTPLEVDVPVLTMLPRLFPCEPLTVQADLKAVEGLKGRLVNFIPDVCLFAGVMDNAMVEIWTVSKHITA